VNAGKGKLQADLAALWKKTAPARDEEGNEGE
jgi:hypothetical protein